MPLDGLTLGFMARELNTLLAGARIERVTQPEKDMLLVFVRNNGKNHKLLLSASPGFARAHVTEGQFINPMEAPMFCMLMRKHILGGRIMGIRQLNGDRVLVVDMESQDELGVMHPYQMYLEAMGRHSNLTLVRDGRIIDAIRHVTDDMSRVRQALPGLPFVPPPAQDKIAPENASRENLTEKLSEQTGRLDKALQQTVSGLSAVAARELSYRMTGSEQTDLKDVDLTHLCSRLADYLQKLPSMQPPVILYDDANLPADVFPCLYLSYPADKQREMPSLSQALDAYYDGRDRQNRMQQRSASLRKLIKTHIERSEKKLALQEEELLNAEKMEDYRIMGELLTAQLHLVPRGADKVQLNNYYDGQMLEVPLDVRLTPAQNAQRYFKRYQKARAAVRLAAEQKEKTLRELEILESALCDLDTSETEDDLSDVRRVLQDAGLMKKDSQNKKKQVKNQRQSAPMRFEAEDGTAITVGKNSLQNERITQSARGDEIWLHAKDMPGSHVIIHNEGKPVSDATLLTAANLAAWFSKGKGLSVPVDMTLKKYVKKPAGTPTGFVTYTHQKTYRITVSEADIRAIKQLKNK